MLKLRKYIVAIAIFMASVQAMAGDGGAFLEITAKVDSADRSSAAEVYKKYKQPFLDQINGAVSKQLLIRDADIQVLHGFKTIEDAQSYLESKLFNADVVGELGPFLKSEPEIRIYSVL